MFKKLIVMFKKLLVILFIISLVPLTECGRRGSSDMVVQDAVKASPVIHKPEDSLSAEDVSKSVVYSVADHYFVNNSVKEFKSHKITDASEFEQVFGMAAVMGKNGEPTKINFAKQYVIAVVKPETDRVTTLTPVSLVEHADGKMLFTYRCETGASQSYTMRPCLIVIVDKAHDGDISIREIQ